MGNLILKTPTGSLRLSIPDSGGGGGGSGDGSQAILTQADLTPLDYYEVAANIGGGDLNYGQGFTHRYVGDQLYFITSTYNNGFVPLEFAKPNSYGDLITTPTRMWPTGRDGAGPWPAKYFFGMHWDEATGRLITTEGIDYPETDADKNIELAISARTLNDNGTISGFRGFYGLQGVSHRQIYGGAVRLPAWFQSAYGAGEFGVGFGGYASLASQGGACSFGPTLFSIPEPTDFADGTVFTPSQYKTLMTCVSGNRESDWYAFPSPTDGDRGVRNSDVTNEFDSGNWPSPSPDGLGRWAWGDSNWNTGVWINGPNKQGFITVPTLCAGRAWYEGSTLHRERFSYEIQIFDPHHFGEVIGGTRQPWDVKPTSRWEIQPAGLYTTTPGDYTGANLNHGIVGASFDDRTGILYLYGTWMLASLGLPPNSRIYAYQVNS